MNFAEQVRGYVDERLPAATPHGDEEMFLRLLEHGAHARSAGNYGIAAAFVVRSKGTELICFGQNTVFSELDPAGHAELNSLRLARRIATAHEDERHRLLSDPRCTLVRGAPHEGFETLLYSTLEPCPMCTVGILNAAVGRVVVAERDDPAGALLHLDRLPPLWSTVAASRGIEIRTVDRGAGGEPSVPMELLDLLRRLFLDGKDDLDDRLSSSAALPIEGLGEIAHRWRAFGLVG